MEILIGITFKNWMKLLFRHRRDIPLSQTGKIINLTIMSIFRNSYYCAREKKEFARAIRNVTVHSAPVFVLGHWRSGTSHLHRLLTLGEHFTYPTVFDIYSPHSFLYTEPMLRERMNRAESQMRPMDNMKIAYNDPGEDEFALAVMTLMSPLLAWVFPKQTAFYDRYLSFEDIPETEIALWREQFLHLLKKLTVRQNRPVILKSPQHTSRIKLIREMFPDARFIHIHRNPYTVYQSTVKLYEKTVAPMQISAPLSKTAMHEGIIRRYADMYKTFLEQKETIPSENFIEVSYEALDKQPEKVIESIFNHFQFDSFENYRPLLKNHLNDIGTYTKNVHKPIEQPWLEKINREWDFAFKAWQYDKES
ncbi:MAG: sulfotransferase [Calditrichaeota bacterium]|nr:MAG: sulfotransferase [Calditrichota bacterium]